MEKGNGIWRHWPMEKKPMSDFSGYSHKTLLRKGKKASVYRGIRDRDHQCVLLKVLTSQSPSIIDHASFLHQYDFYSQLKMKEFVTPIEVEQMGNTYALVYRDPGGMLLKEYIKNFRPWSAGEKAKNAALFDKALNYFKTGIELLPENYWEVSYELSYKLFLGKGESEYLNGLFLDSERTFNEILIYAKTREDQLKVYNMKTLLFSHQQQFEKAVEAGLKGLRLFGWKLPRHPSKFKVILEMIRTKKAVGTRSANDLTTLPTMTDRNTRLLMEILINLNRASYQYDQYLVSILMLRALRLTLRHGTTDVSALVYNNYALFLIAGFQDYEGSFQFGQLALHTASRFQSKHLMGRVDFVFGTFVNHWKKTIEDNLFYIKRSRNIALNPATFIWPGNRAHFWSLQC